MKASRNLSCQKLKITLLNFILDTFILRLHLLLEQYRIARKTQKRDNLFVSVNTNEQSAKAREHKNIDYEILRKKSRCFWNFNPVSVGFCMRSEALVYLIVSFFLIFLTIKVTVNCSVVLSS